MRKLPKSMEAVAQAMGFAAAEGMGASVDDDRISEALESLGDAMESLYEAHREDEE